MIKANSLIALLFINFTCVQANDSSQTLLTILEQKNPEQLISFIKNNKRLFLKPNTLFAKALEKNNIEALTLWIALNLPYNPDTKNKLLKEYSQQKENNKQDEWFPQHVRTQTSKHYHKLFLKIYYTQRLICSAAKNNTQRTSNILNTGINPSEKSILSGKTALHASIYKNAFETTRQLIYAGAQPNIKDGAKQMPLENTQPCAQGPASALLILHGAQTPQKKLKSVYTHNLLHQIHNKKNKKEYLNQFMKWSTENIHPELVQELLQLNTPLKIKALSQWDRKSRVSLIKNYFIPKFNMLCIEQSENFGNNDKKFFNKALQTAFEEILSKKYSSKLRKIILPYFFILTNQINSFRQTQKINIELSKNNEKFIRLTSPDEVLTKQTIQRHLTRPKKRKRLEQSCDQKYFSHNILKALTDQKPYYDVTFLTQSKIVTPRMDHLKNQG